MNSERSRSLGNRERAELLEKNTAEAGPSIPVHRWKPTPWHHCADPGRTDTPPALQHRGGRNSTVRAPQPEFPEAGSVPREGSGGRRGGASAGNAAAGGRREGGNGHGGRSGRFGGHPGAGRPRACNRGLDASRRLEVPGGTADSVQVPETRGRRSCPRAPRPNVRRPLPRPTRPGPTRRQRRVPAVEPAAPAPPPARPLPARRVGRGEKERASGGRGGSARPPLTMVRGAETSAAGDALSRVAGVPLPRAPAAPAPLTHTHARRAHVRRPRLPAPSSSRRSRAALGAAGPFRAPAAPAPSPRRGERGGGGGARWGGGCPGRPRATLPGAWLLPRRPLPGGRRFAGPAGARGSRPLNVRRAWGRTHPSPASVHRLLRGAGRGRSCRAPGHCPRLSWFRSFLEPIKGRLAPAAAGWWGVVLDAAVSPAPLGMRLGVDV